MQVDKMHGVGVYRFVGGAKFRGEWKFGKMVCAFVHVCISPANASKSFLYAKNSFLNQKCWLLQDGYGIYENFENNAFAGKFEGQFLEVLHHATMPHILRMHTRAANRTVHIWG